MEIKKNIKENGVASKLFYQVVNTWKLKKY